MLFYIFLFVTVVGILLCSKKKRTTKIAFFILWMVYAFRDNVGVDDGNYIQVFEYIQRGWEYDVEWSCRTLCKLALTMGLNYKTLFIVYGTLSMVLLYKAIDLLYESHVNKAIYMACFFGTVFVSSVSVMRQFLAACFCFYAAAVMYKEDKLLKPIIYCVIGSIFHTGAAISIPIMFLIRPKVKISYSTKILVMVACVACGYLNVANLILNLSMKILPQSYQIYSGAISGSFSSAGGTLSLLLMLLFVFQCVISWRARVIEPIDPMDVIIEKGQLLYLGILFFFVHAGVASRLAFTFLPFAATIPITFVKRIQRRQRRGIVLALILAMMVLMIMTLNSVSQVQKGAFIPYNASFKFWN